MRWLAPIAWLLCLANPCLAQDSFPALYDVSGVSAGDVLNIRSGDTAGSEAVGFFAPDTKGIEILRTNADGTWGLVNAGEATAWVSLAYLARQPGQQESLPKIRRCVGTEPFWSINIDPPSVQLATPDAPGANGLVSSLFTSASRRDRYVYAGSLQSEDAGPLELVLALRREICSDGMSDREYGFDVDVLIKDNDASDGLRRSTVYSGCCTLYAAP